MERVIEVGSIWIGKINSKTEVKVMSYDDKRVEVKVISNGNDVSSVDVFITLSKEYFLESYARQVSMEYIEGYEEVRKFGHSDAKKEYEEKYKSEFVEVGQHHYDMGYNDALAHMASQEAEKELVANNQGYEDGFDDGWLAAVKAYGFGTVDKEYEKKLEEEQKKGFDNGYNEGYNKSIKEMSNSQALGETTAYDFGTDNCCEHYSPNKETQEAMQEVSDRDANEFAGVWVAKDGSGKLKVLNINEGICDVELVEHNKVSFLCIGGAATISVDDLKEHWNKEHAECNYTTTEYDQLQKELLLVEKYPHYYKDIRHLNIIDIYRFFDLFEVTDPCIQHSVKKLAVGGKRGAKDYEKDIKEAMDTLKRWEYMQEENKRGLND